MEVADLDFGLFDKAWNEERLNRLDFYLSDLARLLRVGDILPVPVSSLWDQMATRWVNARQAFRQTMAAAQGALDLVNNRFRDLYRLHYAKWLGRSDVPVTFAHQFLPRVLQPYWDPQGGRKLSS